MTLPPRPPHLAHEIGDDAVEEGALEAQGLPRLAHALLAWTTTKKRQRERGGGEGRYQLWLCRLLSPLQPKIGTGARVAHRYRDSGSSPPSWGPCPRAAAVGNGGGEGRKGEGGRRPPGQPHSFFFLGEPSILLHRPPLPTVGRLGASTAADPRKQRAHIGPPRRHVRPGHRGLRLGFIFSLVGEKNYLPPTPSRTAPSSRCGQRARRRW